MSALRSETHGLRGAAGVVGAEAAAAEKEFFTMASMSDAVDTGMLLSSSSARSAKAAANRFDAPGRRRARRSRRAAGCGRDSLGTSTLMSAYTRKWCEAKARRRSLVRKIKLSNHSRDINKKSICPKFSGVGMSDGSVSGADLCQQAPIGSRIVLSRGIAEHVGAHDALLLRETAVEPSIEITQNQ
eukprot:9349942-Pyramimonas_sp.AAC.1